VFVEKYNFDKTQEKQMMQQARHDIDKSSLLIAEVSEKAIGVGIEIGYAIALNKPVIYLRNSQSEYSTTVGGIVDHHIVYSSLEDLR
jgi:2'-deoxynucleoside 5'-phosphate N-hydrolase